MPGSTARMVLKQPPMLRSTISSNASGVVSTQATPTASPPSRRISAATGSIAATSRPTSARRHPSRPKARETAAPMPFAGPVIIATRPFRFRSIDLRPVQVALRSKQRLRQIGRRRQELVREDLLDFRRARKLARVDQDVDRLLQPCVVDIAEADLGDLGMVHLVLER